MVDTSMPQIGSPAELAQRCGLAAGVSLDPQGGPALDSENGEAATGNFSDVSLVLSEANQGPGTLFVTSRRIIWVGVSNTGSEQRPSYSVPFSHIMMHAVASPSDAFPQHSIYMQLDGVQSADGEDDDGAAPEVRLAPADPTQLDAIFQALCEGALANPDPDAEDDEGDFFYDEDEVAAGAAANGGSEEHSALADRLDAVLQVPPQYQLAPQDGQFDDAELDEDNDGATPNCSCCQPR